MEKRQFSPPWCHQALAPFHLWLLSSVPFLTFLCQMLIEGEDCIHPPTGLLNHLRPRHLPGHQPDRHGQVLCALCFLWQPLAAWNSSGSQEKRADLRCPPQDIHGTEFRGWDALCSVQMAPKQVQGHVCHLQDWGATSV